MFINKKASASAAIALAVLLGACVDDEQFGVSNGLLVVEPLASPLRPGSTTELAFQAVDDNGDGVPDQTVEAVITDPSRLHFSSTANDRVLVVTGRSDRVNGVLLAGAVVVQLVVPKDATPGTVAVVASLAGDRGASSKTQWASFQVGDGGAQNGDSGSAGTSGLAGSSGEGGNAGTGGNLSIAGADDTAGLGGIETAGANN